jgi:hypothetical protein
MHCRAVCRPGHKAIEHIELTHEVAFADAADRRIARHLPYVLGAKREQADSRAPPRGSCSGLAARVPGAND